MEAGEEMARRRAVSNLLALAVLVALTERPMHPYEMATTMRSQGKERSIKLNYGSLYTVVGNLAKHGLIEAMGARREGRRPERTVYRVTDAGRKELDDWMAELVAVPVKEYPQFEAALAELPVLPPARAMELLRDRASALEKRIAETRAELAELTWLPRLFMLEAEYHVAMQEAELRWVRGLVTEFEDRTFPGLDGWQHVHDTREWPAEWGPVPEEWATQAGGLTPGGEDHARKEDAATNRPD
ncbi:MAG TPA: PadR family transcriptional regulator [Streptosporangiaceae bacterium]|nr:PadR family transcriptional regulator [Streptosporangiaceae bacterium]